MKVLFTFHYTFIIKYRTATAKQHIILVLENMELLILDSNRERMLHTQDALGRINVLAVL